MVFSLYFGIKAALGLEFVFFIAIHFDIWYSTFEQPCDKVDQIFVYAIVNDLYTKDQKLLETFQNDVWKSDKVKATYAKLYDLVKKKGISELPRNEARKAIKALISRLASEHSPDPCILLLDELQPGFDDRSSSKNELDWSDVVTNVEQHHSVV